MLAKNLGWLGRCWGEDDEAAELGVPRGLGRARAVLVVAAAPEVAPCSGVVSLAGLALSRDESHALAGGGPLTTLIWTVRHHLQETFTDQCADIKTGQFSPVPLTTKVNIFKSIQKVKFLIISG